MNFQGLSKVEKSDFYLDLAFQAAKRAGNKTREEKYNNRLLKSRHIEIDKIKAIDKALTSALSQIITKYPSMDSLPEFYQELINTALSIEDIKRSLSKVNYVVNKTKEFTRLYSSKITRTTDFNEINIHRREYYGRISSLIKQIKDDLDYLEMAREEMKGFPSIKTNLPTVCICGFPNVGKSTLLKNITNSDVEISAYAFTTRKLLIGYKELGYEKVQFIDTPGVLNRKGKENIIEHQAYLAVKYLAKFCIFVIDLSLGSGYDVKDQIKLLVELKKRFEKDFLVYLSKVDLLDDKTVSDFIKQRKNPVFTNTQDLLKEIEMRVNSK